VGQFWGELWGCFGATFGYNTTAKRPHQTPEGTAVKDRVKTYRRKLPRPDERGRIRSVVGQTMEGSLVRFTVGTHETTSPTDAMKRLDAIRNLYARQCAELGIDYWAGWVQEWAYRLSQAVPIVVYASVNAG
jgi:hypothetical protein